MAEKGEGERGVDDEGLCIVGNTAEGHKHRVSQRAQSVVCQPYESLTLFWRLIIYSKQQVPVQ